MGDCAFCNQKGNLIDALTSDVDSNNEIHTHSCDNSECGLVYEVNINTQKIIRFLTSYN